MSISAVRGTLIFCRDDPFLTDPEKAIVHEPDGLVICCDGLIEAVGSYAALKAQLPADADITDHSSCLIAPGFIDTHIHYVQTGIIGAQGHQLLAWLNDYTFVAEQAFADEAVARDTANLFCDELVRNGTTTALVFCSVHPGSVDALFEAAAARNLRLIAGKVLMDRNAPEKLLDTPKTGYDDSKALIKKWHNRGRLMYAITPRFAPTSTPEQLEAAGALCKEHPECYMQTHVSENKGEVAWVKELFPDRKGYLDVYDHYSLCRPRAVFGHGIHLTDDEMQVMHRTGSAIAHCPTSNFFLGSGFFNIQRAMQKDRPVRVGLGTDLGAGTSFSILATLNEAYKAAQLNSYALSACHAYYVATRGTAHAMYLEDKIGSISPGMEADIVVLDMKSTPIISYRMEFAKDFDEALFIQMTLGDDRAVQATYVAGVQRYDKWVDGRAGAAEAESA